MTEVSAPTLFERAAKVFDGWTDPETGVRVLRLFRKGEACAIEDVWQTLYQQCGCFLNGGREVLLRTGQSYSGLGGKEHQLLDLTTGQWRNPFPAGYKAVMVFDATNTALLRAGDARAVLWDLQADAELASLSWDDWRFSGFYFLGDGRRALVSLYRGRPYNEPVQSQIHLLSPGEAPRLLLEADGYFCNHMQGCPADPELYAYDRWPSPHRPVEQVIHVATLDGRLHEPAALNELAPRPQDMWGCRDHYVWTPDGNRIVSYLNPTPMDIVPQSAGFNHFALDWWLSALDWRTGEDYAAPYPAGRWGGHMQITPDSQYIVSAGGPGFDKLYAVSIAELRAGWNEHVICSYPTTTSIGKNSDPFPYPFVLPDGSGVIFSAGWYGNEHGVYLAEWPKALG
ncbi:MAG: hypothetical protein ACYC6A_18785 [Armatimonadota bacterium]